MGLAALFGFAISIVGVVLVWITFWETRRQANVAESGLLHTREAMRARITPVRVTLEDRPEQLARFYFITEYQSGGSTAIHRLVITAFYQFRPLPGEPIQFDAAHWDLGTTNPGQPIVVHGSFTLTDDQLAMLKEGRGRVMISILASYYNTFGQEWSANQLLSLTKESWEKGTLYTVRFHEGRVEEQAEREGDAKHQPDLDL